MNQIDSALPRVQYLPAELREAKSGWYVQYHVFNPVSGKLERKVVRFNRVKLLPERRKQAKLLIADINKRLESGWNPYIEQDTNKGFAKLKDAIDLYLSIEERNLELQQKRPHTLRTYRSALKNLTNWLESKGKQNILCIEFNGELIRNFLDYKFLKKRITTATYNNYRGMIYRVCAWMIQYNYLKNNPVLSIPVKRAKPKRRKVLSMAELNIVFNSPEILPAQRLYYRMMFYTLIRPLELCKLKVKDINLRELIIVVPGEISKNGKTQAVGLQEHLALELANHMRNADQEDFVFSRDLFKCGPLEMDRKKVSDGWAKLRKKYELNADAQLYSLKDSGITAMIQAKIDPLQVRDQARHHDISITNTYMPVTGSNIGKDVRMFVVKL